MAGEFSETVAVFIMTGIVIAIFAAVSKYLFFEYWYGIAFGATWAFWGAPFAALLRWLFGGFLLRLIERWWKFWGFD